MTEMLTYTTFRDMTVQNTPKSDNLSKRRIHDAEIATNMQIIFIRCVKCPHLSRISDLGVFLRDRIYR